MTQEHVHHLRIKVSPPVVTDVFESLFDRPCLAVMAVGRERIPTGDSGICQFLEGGADEAVFATHGGKSDMSDEEILEKLLALNLERSR
jgi:hypothetical protein